MDHADWAARVAAAHAAGRPVALLFDYGGTLTPIAAHPSLAAFPDRTRDALADLAALDGVTVGVLSGRTLGHLKELVGLAGVRYAGSGGTHLDLNGEELTDPSAAEFEEVADAVVTVISEAVRWFPGAWVERKPGCLTVHYRQLTPLKSACFRDEVRDALADLTAAAAPLRVRDAARALEVALAGSWTKGDAAERMLADLGPDVLAVYAGDGPDDEEAFDRVNGRGGVTVGVGPDAPAGAALRVATQEGFAADLARLAGSLARPVRAAVPRR